MVIQNIVLIKIPLVDAGRNDRSVSYADCRNGFSPRGKRFLDADAVGLSAGLAADGDHIAAQADAGVLHALRKKVFLQAVGDVSFGDKTGINGGPGVLERHGIALQPDGMIINMRERFRDCRLIRYACAAVRTEIP